MPPSPAQQRIEAIDLARGVAICLMVLSHGVNGLLEFDQFTDWGMVPVHALTKIASSLFILVFGVALAVAFVPHTDATDWPARRRKLLLRGLVVLFWYKLLTIVEMFALYPPEAVLDTLLYRDFPSYVEILGFYAIALLWIPWVLPLWARTPAWLRLCSPLLLAALWWMLLHHHDFGGRDIVQALLVEHEDYYTWGQLARGPLILVGLLIGGAVLQRRADAPAMRRLALLVAGAGVLLLALFALHAGSALGDRLDAIARNAGKHPPEAEFMAFSVGGALLVLGLALLGGNLLARLLRPVTLIGTEALAAFVFHIVVIFVVFRWMLGYLHTITYMHALMLTLALIAATAAWVWLLRRIRSTS